MIRIVLPQHLRTLAHITSEVQLNVEGPATLQIIFDELEIHFPMLKGTIRDHVTQQRRPYLRFFACGKDISHEPFDFLLPEEVNSGEKPFMIIGAIAGG
ncbi:MoaD/ThiS family protein [Endozoicomonas sp. SM1973]|uniref:MoaD/ThiS family protein n=1 Tax=Spartinivicinus marinus TaxID=2994442 RepID=A0A853IGN8_9GAMM|nr:MoaD/ThiS family protein [Spartinivicinus marinus]MCX4026414.1 MoaD/ThiS family protein [Spartinivicinus marinus]NYZ69161.1 MoaD/ThiS family protein [Spartinivicinus marinus]